MVGDPLVDTDPAAEGLSAETAHRDVFHRGPRERDPPDGLIEALREQKLPRPGIEKLHVVRIAAGNHRALGVDVGAEDGRLQRRRFVPV